MENNNENQNMNTQAADASYYLDPYYNLDPYEKNPYYDQAPYPKSVPRKEPIRMLGQNTSGGYPNQMPFGGPGYPNQMVNGGIVYPNGVSYEEYEAQKRARASKSDADGSLVLGICSIIAFWTLFGGFVFGIVGIYLAIRSSKKAEGNIRGVAIAGLVCSVVGLFLACSIVFPIFL